MVNAKVARVAGSGVLDCVWCEWCVMEIAKMARGIFKGGPRVAQREMSCCSKQMDTKRGRVGRDG